MNATQKMYDDAVDNEKSLLENAKSRGAQALRKACDRVLQEAADKIADSMKDSCLKGHVMSGRFLIEHAVELEKQGDSDGAREVRSIVQKLYEQAEAMGDIDEDDDVTAASPAPAFAPLYN